MISDIKKETTNKFDCTPSLRAIDVVSAETRAAWLEGIPPVRQAMVRNVSLKSLRFVRNNTIADLITWARNQLVMADSTMGFSRKALNGAVRSDIATDIMNQALPRPAQKSRPGKGARPHISQARRKDESPLEP
jgi:hypothetical protein